MVDKMVMIIIMGMKIEEIWLVKWVIAGLLFCVCFIIWIICVSMVCVLMLVVVIIKLLFWFNVFVVIFVLVFLSIGMGLFVSMDLFR